MPHARLECTTVFTAMQPLGTLKSQPGFLMLAHLNDLLAVIRVNCTTHRFCVSSYCLAKDLLGIKGEIIR